MARSTKSGGKVAGSSGASDTETPATDPVAGDLAAPSAPEPSAGDTASVDHSPPDVVAPASDAPVAEASTDSGPSQDDGIEDAVVIPPETPPAAPDTATDGIGSPDATHPDPAGPGAAPPEPAPTPPDPEAPAASSEPPRADAPPPAAPPRARPSFVPMVLGGAIAAGLGYAAAWTDILPRPPDPTLTPQVAALATEQRALDARIAALASDIADLAARPDEDTEARAGLEAALQRIADEGAALRALIAAAEATAATADTERAGLSDRLTALENRPQVTVALSEAAQAAVEDQIAGLRREAAEALARVEADRETLAEDAVERFDALQLEVRSALAGIAAEQAALESARSAAAAEAEADRRAAAEASLRAAVESGAPLADTLQALADITGAPPPEALSAHAQDGVPTLASLRETFPDSARAALDAALRAQVDAGEVGRIEGFLRVHSGIRSLAPQAGDSPDAVLSRAEAALSGADIAGALALVATLPPEGRAAMQPWVDQAETRRAALAALDALGAM